jgi:uncharacterized protein YciI
VLFAFIGRDHPDRSAIRQKIRPQHKSYLGEVSGSIAFAGPLLSDAGEMQGSLLVIDFEDREAAEEWIAGEPFTIAGLYRSMDIIAFENLWPQRAGFPPDN